MSLAGHSDSITGMRLSPDGTHLLTNSMDNTLRCGGSRAEGRGWLREVLAEQSSGGEGRGGVGRALFGVNLGSSRAAVPGMGCCLPAGWGP